GRGETAELPAAKAAAHATESLARIAQRLFDIGRALTRPARATAGRLLTPGILAAAIAAAARAGAATAAPRAAIVCIIVPGHRGRGFLPHCPGRGRVVTVLAFGIKRNRRARRRERRFADFAPGQG